MQEQQFQTVPMVITSPNKGVVQAVPREGQPPETVWNAINCLPYDRWGRKRLCQRPGLTKQYPTQLASGFVQGMIEAPNIVYPPNAITIPVYTVAYLPGWGPFDTPGTTGPYNYTGPTNISFTLQFEWDFNIAWSLGCSTDGSDPWGLDTMSATAVFYFMVNGTPTTCLILQVGAGGNLCSADSAPVVVPAAQLTLNAYAGDPTNPGSWLLLGSAPTYSAPPPGDATDVSLSVPANLTVKTNGAMSISLNGNSTSISFPYPVSEVPEMNCQSVEVDPYFGGGGTTGASQTLTITD